MTHAAIRAVERYGRKLDLARIVHIVQSGRAKFWRSAHDGCAFYDVPYVDAGTGTTTNVRALMSADNTFVITVVPPQTFSARYKERGKQVRGSQAKRKREFFKGFEGDED